MTFDGPGGWPREHTNIPTPAVTPSVDDDLRALAEFKAMVESGDPEALGVLGMLDGLVRDIERGAR